MKKRITILAAVLAVATLAAATFVYAGPGGHRRPGGHGFHALGVLGHLDRIQEELDLSDQQTDQIKAIIAEAHEQNAQYREQLHGGLHQVAKTLLANPNDLTGAQAVLDQQLAAERALKSNLLNATSRALNVLTAEQRGKLTQILAEHAERRERRRR
ncbi:MAG TPA: Spy/CpxP family protein refolding chaperone [Thermoanaerobaculia bacterium]|nr:Spy/CpxP family protein refolding chaperone [Thermoanaerobaculia bacterium]